MKNQNLGRLRHFKIEDSITEKAYLLSTMILSQYDIINLKHPSEEYWCIFTNNFQEKFDSNFMKELVRFAGILRALLDIESIYIPIENEEHGFDQSVGQINLRGNTEPLCFREACNKIIHANQYEIRLNYSESHPLDNSKNGYKSIFKSYKNPIIVTYGEFQGKNWNSELNFMKFVEMSINLPIYTK
jgi:hypothetical protein